MSRPRKPKQNPYRVRLTNAQGDELSALQAAPTPEQTEWQDLQSWFKPREVDEAKARRDLHTEKKCTCETGCWNPLCLQHGFY